MSETLQLQITAEESQALHALDSLVSSLERIKSAVSKGFTSVPKHIEKLTASLSAPIPEENISRIERLADALERLQDVGNVKIKLSNGAEKALGMQSLDSAIQEPRTSGVSKIKSELQSIAPETQKASSGIKEFTNEVEKTAKTPSGLSNIFSLFSNGVKGAFGTSLQVAKAGISGITKSLKAMGSGIKNVGKGIAKSVFNGLGSAFQNLKKRLDLSKTSLGKLFNSLKRIAMYRLIRSAIKAVTDGLKEGTENLYEYSRAVGGSFAKSMDMGKSASLQFKNSIAAAFGPAIQAAIGLLTTLANAAITAANAINMLLSALSGASVWTRATKGAEDYTKAAKGAGGATKGLLADWDELNIIQSKGGGGGGGTASAFEEMFTTEELPDNEWTQLAENIRKAIEQNDWRGVGKLLADKLNGVIGWIDADGWAQKLKGWIAHGLDVAIGLLQYTDFSGLGEKIGNFLSRIFVNDDNDIWKRVGLFARLRLMSVINLMKGILKPELFTNFGNAMARMVTTFFAFDAEQIESIASAFGGTITGIANAAITFFNETDFEDIGSKINEILTKIFGKNGSIDWEAVGGAFRTGFMSVFKLLHGALFGKEKDELDADFVDVITPPIPPRIAEQLGIELTGSNGLFGQLGENVGNAINSLFDFSGADVTTMAESLIGLIKLVVDNAKSLLTTVDFKGIGEKIGTFLKEVFGTGEGASVDWEGIGATLKEALLVPLKLLDGVFSADNEEMPDIGSSFASLINGFFDLDTDEIKEIGTTISTGFNKALKNLYDFLDETNWEQIGENIGNIINEIDWESVLANTWKALEKAVEAFLSLSGGLGKALMRLLHNLISDVWNSVAAKLPGIFGDLSLPTFDSGEAYEYWVNTGKLDGLQKNEKGRYEVSNEPLVSSVNAEKEARRDALSKNNFGLFWLPNEKIQITATEEAAETVQEYSDALKELEDTAQGLSETKKYFDEASQSWKTIEQSDFKPVLAGFDSSLRGMQKAILEQMAKNNGIDFNEILNYWTENSDGITNYNALNELYEKVVTAIQEYGEEWLDGIDVPVNVTPYLNEVDDGTSDFSYDYETEYDTPDISSSLGVDTNELNDLTASTDDFTDAVQQAIDAVTELQQNKFAKKAKEDQEAYIYATEDALRHNLSAFEDYYTNNPLADLGALWKDGIENNIIPMLERAGYDLNSETSQGILGFFRKKWEQSLTDPEWEGDINGLVRMLKEAIETPEDWGIPAPDTTEYTSALDTAAVTAETDVQRILNAYARLVNISLGGTLSLGRMASSRPMYTFAEGGYPTVGDMFIAREAGPEMVGRIGNRTAVANNDQIVAGVASGVAAGQAEQNALLRQQNDYLRRILAKESTVKVEPSASWGRFNKRSEEMRLTGAGA